jgi:hypothetical protein
MTDTYSIIRHVRRRHDVRAPYEVLLNDKQTSLEDMWGVDTYSWMTRWGARRAIRRHIRQQTKKATRPAPQIVEEYVP